MSRSRAPLVPRVSYEERTWTMSAHGWRQPLLSSPYPVHLALLVVLGRAREGHLEHGGERDSVGVIAAEDERVLGSVDLGLLTLVVIQLRRLTVWTLMRPMMISLPSRTMVWNLTIRASSGTVHELAAGVRWVA